MRVVRSIVHVALAGIAVSSAVNGEETEDPGVDFLEYLGSWQEGDEEWVVIAEIESAEAEKPHEKHKPERKEDD